MTKQRMGVAGDPGAEGGAEASTTDADAWSAYLANPTERAATHRVAAIALWLPLGDWSVRELVADVVADTYTGDEPREPATGVAEHLQAEIVRRAARGRRSASRLVRLDSVADHELAAAADAGQPDEVCEAQIAQLEAVLPLLCERFRDDPLATELLRLNQAGQCTREEVMCSGAFTVAQYRNTLRRVRRVARSLARELGNAADAAPAQDACAIVAPEAIDPAPAPTARAIDRAVA
jgi:hypothetical protein